MSEEEKTSTTTQDNTDADGTTGRTMADMLQDDTPTNDDQQKEDAVEDADDSDKDDEGLPGDEKDSETDEVDENKDDDKEPEDYGEFDFSKGKDIEYDMTEEELSEYIEFAKENKLTKEQAQAIIDFDIIREKEIIALRKKELDEQISASIKQSRKEHGEKYSTMHKKNNIVYNKLFDKETRAILNASGISVLPGFFNALNYVSEKISEDTFVNSDRTIKDRSKRTLGEALSD